MEDLAKLKEYLLMIHPIRKSGGQKEEFRKWLAGELRRSGWRSHEEHYGKLNGSVNVIAGDPEKATVFLCATMILPPGCWSPILYHLLTHLLM